MPSSSARPRTSPQTYSPLATKELALRKDPRAANRVPKRSVAHPTTPSPTSNHSVGRIQAKHGSSVRASTSTPPTPATSRRPAVFSDQLFGIAAVRNLLFEDGPKTYCAVDSPPSTPKAFNGSTNDADTNIEIELSALPVVALAEAKSFSPVDSARASDRARHLHVADDLWRCVAGRIARVSGEHGDELAVLACEMFRRLGEALPHGRTRVDVFSLPHAEDDERLCRHSHDSLDFDPLVPLLKLSPGEGRSVRVRRKNILETCFETFSWSSRKAVTAPRRALSVSTRTSFHQIWMVVALFILGALAFIVPLVVLPALDGRAFWDTNSEEDDALLQRSEATRRPPPT